MIFLASEHRGEVEPLLEQFPFEKRGDHYVYDNLVLYVNHGKGALQLAFKSVEISIKYDISIALLFGLAGGISGFSIGDLVSVSKVKLLDGSLNPVYNPIELNVIGSLKSAELVTLLSGFNFDNEYLELFGDIVDKEAYFFARAFKSLDKPCFIFKLISDKNDKSSVFSFKKGYVDIGDFIELLKFIMWIDRDELTREIFVNMGYTDKRLINSLKKLVQKKKYTFTQRQFLYKKLTINSSKCEKKAFKIKATFLEDGVDERMVKLKTRRIYKIKDYVPVFHNLKDRMAIIYANKKGEFLRKTPNSYTPNGGYGYSILAQFNCIYDCSYCFLKGYFKSFNPVVFLNFEDYFKAIDEVIKKDKTRPLYFYAGTYSDPLALSFTNDFLIGLIEHFGKIRDDVFLEIRTKSDRVKEFLSLEPHKNVIFAFSLSPEIVIKRYEFLTPSLERRKMAIKQLDNKGFNIGVRFDPVIIDYLEDYDELLGFVKSIKHLHSVEVGFLRFDKNDYKNMLNKVPCVLKDLEFDRGMYRYSKKKIGRALEFFKTRLDKFYLSMEY